MSNDITLPPVPTTTSIAAPDPVPPDNDKFLYGLGESITILRLPSVAVYPVPGFVIVNAVTIPEVTDAVTAAFDPIVDAIETLGASRYPPPPVTIPTADIVPVAETVRFAVAA